ncbi:MAG: ATP-binding protein [Desulfuromonadaceae bacterium]|nr:ATP-binding protein [Desulfuromonadaceae bacterium]
MVQTDPFVLAVASGKGGTGKTTLSVALAQVAGAPLYDCDVEEPNAHLFVRPQWQDKQDVTRRVPLIETELCTGCGACTELCQFNALIIVGHKAMVFEELCHSCGGCRRVCPTQAIHETDVTIGSVSLGLSAKLTLVQGCMAIGQVMAPPLIRATRNYHHNVPPAKLAILDCPPGTSCPMITAVRGSDFVLLVTEPTPFGLNDLQLAVETVRQLQLPFAVAINRADSGDRRVHDYCQREGIEVVIEIPELRHVAEAYSRGETLLEALPQQRQLLQNWLHQLCPGGLA